MHCFKRGGAGHFASKCDSLVVDYYYNKLSSELHGLQTRNLRSALILMPVITKQVTPASGVTNASPAEAPSMELISAQQLSRLNKVPDGFYQRFMFPVMPSITVVRVEMGNSSPEPTQECISE